MSNYLRKRVEEIVAQSWCDKTTEHIVMDATLAKVLIDKVEQFALQVRNEAIEEQKEKDAKVAENSDKTCCAHDISNENCQPCAERADLSLSISEAIRSTTHPEQEGK